MANRVDDVDEIILNCDKGLEKGLIIRYNEARPQEIDATNLHEITGADERISFRTMLDIINGDIIDMSNHLAFNNFVKGISFSGRGSDVTKVDLEHGSRLVNKGMDPPEKGLVLSGLLLTCPLSGR